MAPLVTPHARAFAARSSWLLPYPLSANRYWRTYAEGFKGEPVTVCSSEAKAYKAQVGWLAKAAGIHQADRRAGRHCPTTLYPKRPQDWAKRASKDPAAWGRLGALH